jgi:hypothetical protein
MFIRRMFVTVAVVEAAYALIGVLVPPSMVSTVIGWNLSPDGQWIAKLLGLALGAQAATAWVLRRQPPLAVAWILALYQLAAATTDWVLWLALADQGIFANAMTRASVVVSIPLHYAIGVLLIAGIVRQTNRDRVAA